MTLVSHLQAKRPERAKWESSQDCPVRNGPLGSSKDNNTLPGCSNCKLAWIEMIWNDTSRSQSAQRLHYNAFIQMAHMNQNNCDMEMTDIDGSLLASGWLEKNSTKSCWDLSGLLCKWLTSVLDLSRQRSFFGHSNSLKSFLEKQLQKDLNGIVRICL